jgi:glyoxalase family protein
MKVNGLHHVTAVTAQAQGNVDFYTGVLGMRMVKRTVNQDDVSAYHLFYADRVGNPGTDLTFFDWAAPPNRNGAGSIAHTALRVNGRESLEWWAHRLTEHGIDHAGITEFHGHAQIRFADPEGQQLALVDDAGAPGGEPWEESPVPAEHSIRGLFASTLIVRDAEQLAHVLTDVMGYEQSATYDTNDASAGGKMIVFEVNGGGAGNEIYVIEEPNAAPGRLGAGGVHHVAFRVDNAEVEQEWRQRLLQHGISVSHQIDRFYFQSIYFRVPGGALFEIATDGPGFATDEDEAHLGETLALPPFLEDRRAEIEAGLKPITYRVTA